MKHVIHDWDDEWAQIILVNCRRAVPADCIFLLVGWVLPEGNAPSAGKFADVAMLLMTGGKERTVEEYRRWLDRVAFRLNQVVPTSARLEHHRGAVRLALLGFTGSMWRAPNGTEPGFSTT